MTENDRSIETYYDPLTRAERTQLEDRLERYRDQLESHGYETTIAEGDRGFFAGVLVIDEDEGRFGFLEDTGSVNWISDTTGGIGALGSAVAQNPTEALKNDIEGVENADLE